MNIQVLWIWLSLACTPGSVTFSKLISKFETPKAIFEATDDQLSAVLGRSSKDLRALSDKNTDKAEEIFKYCTSKNIGILNYSDNNFPENLRNIPTPPVLLYYRGVLPDFKNSFCVSVVGTRRLSEYGLKNAFQISSDLAKAGATIVSGMALGIDGVSHAGALSGGGVTVAVLGSGIDVCYPSEHKLLARNIVKNGCVFTEFAPGTRPERHNFPRRNRIISGLSEATLVIEGKEKSGALLTARHAEEQGRAVYALPGNVGNVNSELSNILIKNGAKLCMAADDIIRDFEDSSSGILNPFLLSQTKSADVYEELKKYSVSAVTSNDRVFRRPYRSSAKVGEAEGAEIQPKIDPVEVSRTMDGFDAETLKVYKKIPQGEECTIESLVDSELSLRKVMKALLRLEVGHFIVMCPGEKCKRNF